MCNVGVVKLLYLMCIVTAICTVIAVAKICTLLCCQLAVPSDTAL
jgi:hypothetical protein